MRVLETVPSSSSYIPHALLSGRQCSVASDPVFLVTLFVQMFPIPSTVAQARGCVPILISLDHWAFPSMDHSVLYAIPFWFFSSNFLGWFFFAFLDSSKYLHFLDLHTPSSLYVITSSSTDYPWLTLPKAEISVTIYILAHLPTVSTACACSEYSLWGDLCTSCLQSWLKPLLTTLE